jgi:hypothetical protein
MDTGAKYADRVDPGFRMAMELVASSYRTMKMVESELAKVDEAERRSHAVAVLEPTLYRDQINSKQFARNMKVVRAAISFIKAVDEVAEELPQ